MTQFALKDFGLTTRGQTIERKHRTKFRETEDQSPRLVVTKIFIRHCLASFIDVIASSYDVSNLVPGRKYGPTGRLGPSALDSGRSP